MTGVEEGAGLQEQAAPTEGILGEALQSSRPGAMTATGPESWSDPGTPGQA